MIQKNIHGWQLLQANGIYMIDSLIDERNIQFFKLYQSFEKLGVFDTTWQKNISKQLQLLNNNIRSLDKLGKFRFSIDLKFKIMSNW